MMYRCSVLSLWRQPSAQRTVQQNFRNRAGAIRRFLITALGGFSHPLPISPPGLAPSGTTRQLLGSRDPSPTQALFRRLISCEPSGHQYDPPLARPCIARNHQYIRGDGHGHEGESACDVRSETGQETETVARRSRSAGIPTEALTPTVLVRWIIQFSQGDTTILFSRRKFLNRRHEYLAQSKFNLVALVKQPLPVFVA